MTPTESREVVLTLSRERLARATARLERTARNATERILHLKEEKRALEQRLKDLEHLFTQERHNFEQRASLLASVTKENEERAKTFAELEARLQDRERLLNEQLELVAQLRVSISEQDVELKQRESLRSASDEAVDEWKSKHVQTEERLAKTNAERDELRAKLYEHERVNAQYVLRYSAEDRDSATRAIDALLDRVGMLEMKALGLQEK